MMVMDAQWTIQDYDHGNFLCVPHQMQTHEHQETHRANEMQPDSMRDVQQPTITVWNR